LTSFRLASVTGKVCFKANVSYVWCFVPRMKYCI